MNRLLVAAAALLMACGGAPPAQRVVEASPDDVTVLYFHGKQRCITCNAIEKLTKEVVEGLKNERVVIRVVDTSKPENEALADQYEVSWSSLIIDRNGAIENLTDMGFSYAKGQPEVFKAELTQAINEMLK